jgi:SAM-dependent methyltransferase
MKRLILEQKWTGGEEDRVWLEQFAVGAGMDICPGDFIIGENSVGVDPADNMICADKQISGDEITGEDPETLDYIVSNYIDVFPTPFKFFREWHRILKVGGVLAFTCRNADAFDDKLGPLANKNRHSLYTPKIVRFYLTRLLFEVKTIELSEGGKSIRVAAKKI